MGAMTGVLLLIPYVVFALFMLVIGTDAMDMFLLYCSTLVASGSSLR